MRSIIAGAVALVGAAALAACADSGPTPGSASSADPAPATTVTTAPPARATTPAPRPSATRTTTKATAAVSDVSQLTRLGIVLGKGVLLDVADDGVDRYLAIVDRRTVDFTGTTRTDSTMMALKAAPVRQKNQVVIKPPFWNEDLGAGSCVADTAGAALTLETCAAGKPAQIWTVVPAGDSGQFELHGKYGVLRVDGGKLTTGGTGRVGLQTIPFAE